jgi:hypothetical protein
MRDGSALQPEGIDKFRFCPELDYLSSNSEEKDRTLIAIGSY